MSLSNDVMPSAEVLTKYLDDLETNGTDAAQAAQAISTLKKNAEKQDNINFKMLKRCLQLKKMSVSDRASEMKHFIHYIRVLGLLDQQDMFDDFSADDVEQAMTPAQQRDLDAAEFDATGKTPPHRPSAVEIANAASALDESDDEDDGCDEDDEDIDEEDELEDAD
jgi:hypothetical protein